MDFDIVFYHAKCSDGLAAAATAYLALGDKAQYIPMSYNEPVPEIVGKLVLVLDFSFKLDVARKMITDNKAFLILDHHKTAFEDLECLVGTGHLIYEQQMSGATITWRYFFPNQEPSKFIRYVEDRDLWLWKMESSREFSLGFFSIVATISGDSRPIVPAVAEMIQKDDIRSVIEVGRVLFQEQQKVVKSKMQTVARGQFKCAPQFLIGFVETDQLQSEIGEAIYNSGYDIAAMYHQGPESIRVSLRSKNHNTTVISRNYGGGGHVSASGFTLTVPLADIVTMES